MSESGTAATMSLAEIKRVALDRIERSLKTLWLVDDFDATVVRREPPPLFRLRDEEEHAADIRSLSNRLRDERPVLRERLSPVNTIVQEILDVRSIQGMVQLLDKVDKLFVQGTEPVTERAEKSRYQFEARPLEAHLKSEPPKLDRDIADGLAQDISAQRFVASVMQMCRDYRRDRRALAVGDRLALEKAYRLLDEGVRMPRNYQWIRTDAQRPTQTYLSFADPGDGHLAVTCQDPDLLEGLIIHVEYIDRDNVDRRELVEAYRLPAVRNASRVRLHVGNASPCTVFIGRPVFEANSFQMGLL